MRARVFLGGGSGGFFFITKGTLVRVLIKYSYKILHCTREREREREAHTHARTRERSIFEALSLFPFSKIVRFVCLFDAIG